MKGLMMRAALLMAALLAAAPVAAQDTPEQVVTRYLETFRAGEYAANAAMMDPAALEEMKATLVQIVGSVGTNAEFQTMFGVQTAEQLNGLAAPVVYERMLRSVLGKEEMRGLLASARVNVLGHVPEGDSAHVVYRLRMSAGGTDFNQVQMAQLRRVGDTWKVLLTGGFAGIMNPLGGAGRRN